MRNTDGEGRALKYVTLETVKNRKKNQLRNRVEL